MIQNNWYKRVKNSVNPEVLWVSKLIGVILVLSMGLTFLMNSIKSDVQKEQSVYKAKIGQKFILGKDTLIIVDYSLLTKTFTLSNGSKVSAELINK